MKHIFFAGFMVFGLGCSVDASHEDSFESENWSYQFSHNGCDTGAHSFTSKDAYCKGLKNDSLNNGCAFSLRQQTFDEKCD